MYPIFFATPWFNVYAYGTMMAIGYMVGTLIILREVRRDGIEPEPIFDMLLMQMVVGVFGARLLYLLEYGGPSAGTIPGFFDFQQGGLTFYGAVISSFFFDLIFLKFKRIPFWKVMDSVGMGLAVGMIFARTGCFLNGCCHGIFCPWPWGVIFPRVSDQPLHPTQLYEASAGFLLYVMLRMAKPRQRSYGQLFVGFLMGYAAFRFIIEFWRGDNPIFLFHMTMSQIISLLSLAVCGMAFRFFENHPELRVPPEVSSEKRGNSPAGSKRKKSR
ncbi:MAG: prolipoprotein diacylglyceryl transferase [Candidatus Ozemobacteraceae bacterium]